MAQVPATSGVPAGDASEGVGAPKPSTSEGDNASSPSSQVSLSDIQLVQNLVEKCLQKYMSKEEVIRTLEKKSNIPATFTTLILQQLEQQNPEFFWFYYLRLKLKDQIVLFNYLLDQQNQMLAKMQQRLMQGFPGPPHPGAGLFPRPPGLVVPPILNPTVQNTSSQNPTAMVPQTSPELIPSANPLEAKSEEGGGVANPLPMSTQVLEPIPASFPPICNPSPAPPMTSVPQDVDMTGVPASAPASTPVATPSSAPAPGPVHPAPPVPTPVPTPTSAPVPAQASIPTSAPVAGPAPIPAPTSASGAATVAVPPPVSAAAPGSVSAAASTPDVSSPMDLSFPGVGFGNCSSPDTVLPGMSSDLARGALQGLGVEPNGELQGLVVDNMHIYTSLDSPVVSLPPEEKDGMGPAWGMDLPKIASFSDMGALDFENMQQ